MHSKQLNSDLNNWKFGTIKVSGTTDEYGQLVVGNPFKTTNVVAIQNSMNRVIAPLPVIAITGVQEGWFTVRVSIGTQWWSGKFEATILCAYQ